MIMKLIKSEMLGKICDIHLIEVPNMMEQFRVPRSKKKRIRKKYRKNPLNYHPSHEVIFNPIARVAFCPSETAQAIRKMIKRVKGPVGLTP